MKLYISGPMTDLPRFNFPTFDAVAKACIAMGHDVVSPAQHDRDVIWEQHHKYVEDFPGYLEGNVPRWSEATGFDYATALRWDLEQVLACDGIVMLPGWENSRGAKAERYAAEVSGKKVYIARQAGPASWSIALDDVQQRLAVEHTEQAEVTPVVPLHHRDPEPVYEAMRAASSTQKMEDPYKVEPGDVTLNAGGGPRPHWALGRTVGEQSEVRVVNETTGGAKGSKLARFDLIPAAALELLAEHYGRGSQKYEDRNWEKGYDWGLSFAALNRHLWAFWGGEDIDAETGSPHLVAVAWHAFTLLTFLERFPELDTRSALNQ